MYLALLSLIYSTWDLLSLLWHAGSLLVACASQVALVAKNEPANARDIRDAGSITGLGRSPGEGYGNSLQYSCLKNPWKEEPGRLLFLGLHRVVYDSLHWECRVLTTGPPRRPSTPFLLVILTSIQ